MKTIPKKACPECKVEMRHAFNATSFTIQYFCKNLGCKKFNNVNIDSNGLIEGKL